MDDKMEDDENLNKNQEPLDYRMTILNRIRDLSIVQPLDYRMAPALTRFRINRLRENQKIQRRINFGNRPDLTISLIPIANRIYSASDPGISATVGRNEKRKSNFPTKIPVIQPPIVADRGATEGPTKIPSPIVAASRRKSQCPTKIVGKNKPSKIPVLPPISTILNARSTGNPESIVEPKPSTSPTVENLEELPIVHMLYRMITENAILIDPNRSRETIEELIPVERSTEPVAGPSTSNNETYNRVFERTGTMKNYREITPDADNLQSFRYTRKINRTISDDSNCGPTNIELVADDQVEASSHHFKTTRRSPNKKLKKSSENYTKYDCNAEHAREISGPSSSSISVDLNDRKPDESSKSPSTTTTLIAEIPVRQKIRRRYQKSTSDSNDS